MDATPFMHAAISLVIQALGGLLTGNWWLGGLVACTWWVAREHTQAEYRWIEKYGQGKRANMPDWAGFDYRVWNVPSLVDFIAPVVACSIVYFSALALEAV